MSRSSNVKTVSRCMWARSLVITQAMTRSAAPLAKRALAICSIMRPCVRSLMPISTAPLPIGITSPPSIEARPKSGGLEPAVVAEVRVPELEVGVGEHRMAAVDRGDVVGLPSSGRPVHRVDRHAAVDPARRVAGEQRVGQRRQHELAGIVDRRADQRRPWTTSPRSSPASSTVRPPIRCVARSVRFEAGEQLAHLVHERPADRVLGGDELDQARRPRRWPPASRPAGPRGGRPPRRATRISATNWSCSYWARSTHSTSSNSSSSWFVGVSRCRLRSGSVDHDLAQLAHLGVDAEFAHARSVLAPSGARTGDDVRARGRLRRSARCRRASRWPPGARSPRRTARPRRPWVPSSRRRTCRASQLPGRDPLELALLGRPPALVHAVDVGGHHEQVGIDLARQQLAGEVLVDHRLDAREHASSPGVEGRRDAAAAGADHDGAVLQQPLDGTELEDPLRARATRPPARMRSPSRLNTHPFSAARASALPRRCTPGRRTWSGRRTPDRRRRPRSS